MEIDQELALIKRNKAPLGAVVPAPAPEASPAPEPAPQPAPIAEPAPTPAPKTPAELDAELGLPAFDAETHAPPDVGASTWEVMGAAWQSETIKTDAWLYAEGKRQELAHGMFDQLSPEGQRRVRARAEQAPTGDVAHDWATFQGMVMEQAQAEAAADPEAAARWAQYPMSEDAFTQRINADRRRDYDAAQAILDQPGGGLAEFIGSSARAMTDEINLPLLPFGASGSAWRVIAGEGLLNGFAEAAGLPREFAVAQELDLPKPDAFSRIATGVALGSGIAAGLIGLGKGIGKAITLRQAHVESRQALVTDGADNMEVEQGIDAAEAKMRGEQTVSETLADNNAQSRRAPEAVSLEYDLAGKVRNKPVSPQFETDLRTVVAPLGDDIGVIVVSAGQDAIGTPHAHRTGSVRHDVDANGFSSTADVVLTRNGKKVTPQQDPELYVRFFNQAGSKFPGIGHYAWGAHVGSGSVAAWGPDTTSKTLDPIFKDAIARGRGQLPAIVRAMRPQNSPGLSYNEDALATAIVGAENTGSIDAKNPNSSAVGNGQFLADTWLELIRANRPDLLQGRTDNEILSLRKDPAISRDMLKIYSRQNHDFLQSKGLPAGPGEVYLAHFLGPGGAEKALRANLEAPVSAIMTPKQIDANKGVRYNGKALRDFTVYDLRQWSKSKIEGSYSGSRSAADDTPAYTPTSRAYTGEGQIAVGENQHIDVKYEVVDATTLLRASGDLQPRDRSRTNSDAWISDTAARLDPAQLMPSPTADRGTPIVGPDNIIESGNGRTAAIERAYARHPDRADAYRAQIEAAGFAIPEGVKQPILVARRTSDLTPEARRQMVIDAQDSGVAQMTPTEVARASSRAMTTPVLARLDPTQPLASEANGAFVRAALGTLPRSARNAMFDAGGLLNRGGERQLREAIFARAWQDADIIEMFTEADSGDLKSLMEALGRAAPNWAALKADIEAGLVAPEMDISGHVLDAMRLIATARQLASREGISIARAIGDLLDEVDMIEGAVAPLTTAMVKKFWRNGRAASADDVAGFLSRYADDARKAGASGGMFDAPKPQDVLRAIDPDTFANLPDDLGPVRGFATPAQKAAPPATGYDTGASSAEVLADDAAARDMLEAPPAGAFGPKFDGFENDPDRAIAHLLQQGKGEIDNAFANADPRLANVSLVYGNDAFGLRHIQQKHPDMLPKLGKIIQEGRIVEDPSGLSRLYVVHDGIPAEFAVIRLDWDGVQKHWIVTAMRDDQLKFDTRQSQTSNEPTASASSKIPDATGQVKDSSIGEKIQGASFAELEADPVGQALQADIAAARAEFSDDLDAIEIDMGDGTTISAREYLADLDADTQIAAAVRACAITPGGA